MGRSVPFDTGRARLLSGALDLAPPGSVQAGLLLADYGATLFHELDDYESAREAFDKAQEIAEKEHDQMLEMRVLTYSAEMDLWALNWTEGQPKGRRAIELARSLDDLVFQAAAMYPTIRTFAAMGQYQEAFKLAEEMLVLAEDLRSATPLMDALWLNGTLCRSVGNWQDARPFLERGLEVQSENTRALSDLAVLTHQVGDVVQGEEFVGRLMESPPPGVT